MLRDCDGSPQLPPPRPYGRLREQDRQRLAKIRLGRAKHPGEDLLEARRGWARTSGQQSRSGGFSCSISNTHVRGPGRCHAHTGTCYLRPKLASATVVAAANGEPHLGFVRRVRSEPPIWLRCSNEGRPRAVIMSTRPCEHRRRPGWRRLTVPTTTTTPPLRLKHAAGLRLQSFVARRLSSSRACRAQYVLQS
jgi:hypothetical protein